MLHSLTVPFDPLTAMSLRVRLTECFCECIGVQIHVSRGDNILCSDHGAVGLHNEGALLLYLRRSRDFEKDGVARRAERGAESFTAVNPDKVVIIHIASHPRRSSRPVNLTAVLATCFNVPYRPCLRLIDKAHGMFCRAQVRCSEQYRSYVLTSTLQLLALSIYTERQKAIHDISMISRNTHRLSFVATHVRLRSWRRASCTIWP